MQGRVGKRHKAAAPASCHRWHQGSSSVLPHKQSTSGRMCKHVPCFQQVEIEDPEPPAQDSQTIEMDVSLDCSNLSSSSLSVPWRIESMVDVDSVDSVSYAI